MSDSKIYLNVPYAQKDEAKALGAKWDAANKKWYMPANLDIGLFTKWHSDNLSALPVTVTKAKKSDTTNQNVDNKLVTYPSIKDFVAYSGDEPPWDQL